MTKFFHSIPDLRGHLRRHPRPLALIPTMGALHAGHERLIEAARREAATVVVSVFVNPTQFNQREDFERYPRALDDDVAVCRRLGVDAVFAPPDAEMYPGPRFTAVEVSRITDHLCGAFRPGHFSGVATVVAKLFNIVRPDRAYFGEKDAQQLAVIRRMVRDLDVPVQIVGVPTVREADGLALSSRNRLLSPAERRTALALPRALREAEALIRGGMLDPDEVKRAAGRHLEGLAGARLEYLEVVDPVELQPVGRIEGPVLVAAALWVGGTRLIDNVLALPDPS
jgi:pantoate--beta-alanine ligase